MYRHPTMTAVSRAGALGLVVLATLAAGCAGPAPSIPPSSTDEPAPARAVAERDGVRVILAIDRQRVDVGGLVRAKIEVVNFQPGTVFWQGGGCDLQAAFRLSGPEQAPQDPGRDWPGEHGILKQVSVSEGLGGFVPPKALARGAALLTCPADLRVNELRSGVTVIANAIWPTTHVNGLPAAPGPYVVSASFPFLARMAAGPFLGDPLDDRRPIDVQLPFAIDGAPVVAISPGQAMDAVLRHAPFTAWLANVPRTRWYGGEVEYGIGVWVFTLRVGMPDERAIVTVDATSGAVRDFRVAIGP
jgi:hypothetical protein